MDDDDRRSDPPAVITRFLDVPFEAPAGQCGAVVIPVPWERSTSYVHGTAGGPAALLAASAQVELYDEELGIETWRAGIETAAPVAAGDDGAEKALREIADATAAVLDRGAVALLLGGEHTVTVGGVRGAARVVDDLSVLQIDAHADLRPSYRDDPYSHASAMARVWETCPVVGAGIRAISAFEARRIEREHLPIWGPRECVGDRWVADVVDRLSPRVYVTVDLDGLDPAVIPAVGTPEPGGLSWQQTLALLRECSARREIVAADVVELCPRPGEVRSDLAAARLAYRILGYALTRGGRRPCPERISDPHEDL